VGVLVQTNFGGVLSINGAPVGRELGRFYLQRELAPPQQGPGDSGDGSIMMIVATDAPLDARNLDRLAARALTGLARTGATMTNGSGDYVIAFSTSPAVRRRANATAAVTMADLPNEGMSPLFEAVAEATEEAIYNSLFKATPVRGRSGTVDALPIARTLEILRRYNSLDQDRTLPPGRP
jgi:D-aminopeptidase